MASGAAPDVLAMVLADAVLKDAATGKHFIQGTYGVISAPEFPIMHPIVIYTAITNGHGKTEIELRLVDVDEDHEPLFSHKIQVDFPDPLVVVEAVFAVKGVVFPSAGEYRIQLFGAGQPIRERRLQVIPPFAPPEEE